jgi:hypothetical protein
MENINTIKNAITNGKTTNHWGAVIFKPYDRFNIKDLKVCLLEKNSKSLSFLNKLNNIQQKMCDIRSKFYMMNFYKEECLYLSKICYNKNIMDENMFVTAQCFIDQNNNTTSIKKLTYYLVGLLFGKKQDVKKNLKIMDV